MPAYKHQVVKLTAQLVKTNEALLNLLNENAALKATLAAQETAAEKMEAAQAKLANALAKLEKKAPVSVGKSGTPAAK